MHHDLRPASFGAPEPRVGFLGLILAILLGLILLFFGLMMLSASSNFVRVSLAAKGTVISIERSVNRDNDGVPSVTYRPTFAYLDAAGLRHTAKPRTAASHYNYAVGAKVAIRYDPARPEHVQVDDWFSRWGLALFVTLGGILIPARAIRGFVRSWRHP